MIGVEGVGEGIVMAADGRRMVLLMLVLRMTLCQV